MPNHNPEHLLLTKKTHLFVYKLVLKNSKMFHFIRMKLACFRMMFSENISMCVMCRKNKIKLTSERVVSLYGILLLCLKTYYCMCTYSWLGEWQQTFLHCHPVLRQVLEQLPHPLPGATSLVRRFPTEIWTNINLGRRDVYNFGWGHKWIMKREDLKGWKSVKTWWWPVSTYQYFPARPC